MDGRLYTLRWLINNPSAANHAEAKRLIDAIIGDKAGSTAAPPPDGKNLPKVAIVVGHNIKAPGADALPPLSANELKFNNLVADEMLALAQGKFIAAKFSRNPAETYGKEIANCYRVVNEWGPAVVIELHFNSASPSATGTEMLHAPSAESLRLAECLLASTVDALGLKSRGLKRLSFGDRGAGSLFAAKAPCVIAEPFFGSNRSDCEAVHRIGPKGLAAAYIKGLIDYFNE